MNPNRFPTLRILSFCAACVGASVAARADEAADLRTTLLALGGGAPVKADVRYTLNSRDGEGDKAESKTATVSAQVEAGPQGLQIFWSKDQLRTAVQDGKSNPQIGRAMNALSATHLSDYLNAAPEMLRSLEEAQLTNVTETTWEDHPARLLTFKITPKLREKDRKYIKELDTGARIWVGADGVPLAAERHLHLKGRAMLVITFEQTEKEQYRFRHVGDRLIVIHHEKESAGSGGGEHGQQKSTANVTVEG